MLQDIANKRCVTINKTLPAQLDYRGAPGVTQSCLEALAYFLQEERVTGTALLISGPRDRYDCRSHLFLLLPKLEIRTVIRNGFSSGYGGEGPKGLSQAILLLDSRGWDLNEVTVTRKRFDSIVDGLITDKQLDFLLSTRRRPKSNVYDYVFQRDLDRSDESSIWDSLPFLIPLPLIERRLIDLAVRFWENPDDALHTAYRRLEDQIRKRSGLQEHGTKLFSKAFGNDNSPLAWFHSDKDSTVFAQLFIGTYSGFRNLRAHRELRSTEQELALEFMQVNTLYVLEGQLRVRREIQQQTTEA